MEKKLLDLYRNKDETLNDAFDRLVVNLHIHKEKKGYKSFVISGCEPQAGATTIAINLAISMAMSGWKTILVDMDLRKLDGSKRLSDKVEIGLSDYLKGMCEEEEIICDTNYELLKYISCGPSGENPVRLLCSNRMSEYLKNLEKYYDYVILDLPSIYAAIDTNILTAKADAVILVAAQQSTTTTQIQEAKKIIENIGGTLLGVVVNKVEMNEYKHFMKFYDYFKSKRYLRKIKNRAEYKNIKN